MCRCNPGLLDTALWMCNSTTILLVEGTTVNVTHYTMITPGQNGTIEYDNNGNFESFTAAIYFSMLDLLLFIILQCLIKLAL